MNIKPIGERLVVKQTVSETKTNSGIFIPDSAKEKQNSGEVVAVGKIEGDEIKVGERVLYSKFAGSEIELDGEKLIILEKNDVLAVI
ncbi:MAG: co-chaperone GroES [Bacteroidales bacterium]|nr:co-chaperone GroES [Bacteroidales bacterium]